MDLRKKVVAVVSAAACLAATAAPALAFENEFHGLFRLFGATTNFNETPVVSGFYLPEGLEKKVPTTNYIAQRARLMYIAKASDDLKLVTHFEIDSRWGDSSLNVKRNQGGAIGGDQINLETKNVYLDFKIPSTPVNVKVGLQGNDDAFKGVMFGADMAGVLASGTFGKTTASLGFFRFNDDKPTTTSPVGKVTRDMLTLDGKYAISKDVKVGGAYYLVNDDRTNPSIVHSLGVNAEGAVGPVTLDGFFLYQFGTLEATKQHLSAFAGNVGARMKLGPGTARSEFLYVSGENEDDRSTSNAFQSVDDEHGFYNGNMQLLFRDAYAMTIDNAIVYTSNNLNRGVIAGFLGYDLPITSKLSASANAGFAAVAKVNDFSINKRKSNYLGTEINAQLDYKVYDNLTVIARGAYVILGDYYKGVATGGADPENPYMASLIMNYTF